MNERKKGGKVLKGKVETEKEKQGKRGKKKKTQNDIVFIKLRTQAVPSRTQLYLSHTRAVPNFFFQKKK